MTRRHLATLVHVLATIAGGLAVLTAFGLWFLSRGPISLDAVTPAVSWLLARGTNITVDIEHTFLSLDARGLLVVQARGVHLHRAGSDAVLTLGDLALDFRPSLGLFRGTIAPTRIIIDRPDLRLQRDPDGSFHLGIGDLSSDTSEDWSQSVVSDLVHPPQGRGVLGYLRQVAIENASLTVEDRALNLEWHAASASASLIRESDHTDGQFRIVVGQRTNQARFDGDFVFLPTFNQLVVRLGFKDLQPAQWAETSPALAGFAALNVPISGELRGEFDPTQLTLRDAIVDLSLGKGELRQAALPGGTLAIAGATLQGGYDALQGRINLGLLSLNLNPGTISLAGTIDGVGTDLLSGGRPKVFDTAMTITAAGLKLDDFPRLWPEGAAASTRDWVTEHIHDGTVDDLKAQLALHVDLSGEAAKPAQLQQFDGTMRFSNLSIEYFRPLPPVKGVSGTAQFDRTQIEFKAASGDVGKIHASAATARFYQLETNDEQAKIAVTAQGPLADALSLLDTAPLYYAREIGLDPKRSSGNFTAHLNFAFPLINKLLLKDVAYGADATLTDVGLGAVMFDRDLSQGALQLKLDPATAQVDGTAQLAGVPLALTWRQSLKDDAAVRTRYDVKAALDAAQCRALGLDAVADMLTAGSAALTARYERDAKKRAHAVVNLDLGDAALDAKRLNWKKAAGVAATAQVAFDLNDDKLAAISDATFNGVGMDIKAAASFDDRGLSGVTIDHVLSAENDFRGRANRDGGGWKVVVTGKSLDASGVIDELNQAPPSQGNEPPLSIAANLDRLRLGPQRVATAVALSLVSDGPHWQHASLDAKLSDKTSAQLRYDASGERPFTLATDDFGALMKLLDIYGDAEGGKFDLTGKAEDRDGRRVLVAKAVGSNYRIVRAPVLARLLSVASLSGIGALLTGQGIPFNRVEGDFTFSSDKITLSNMRAYGGAIGINASGTLDRTASQIDVSGTLVPAYTLNSVIGDIPLIGNLLVGGEGQGVFASNFRLYGKLDDPQVSVNALSTLAPGVLRNLFLFSPGGP